MGISLRGSVAIVGVGETTVGSLPDSGSTEICAEAARQALLDAGLLKNQVDGLITCNPWVEPHLYHAEMFSEYMQIFPRYCMALNAGGATSLTAVQRAASAIVTGVCDTVLITHGDNPRTAPLHRHFHPRPDHFLTSNQWESDRMPQKGYGYDGVKGYILDGTTVQH